MAGKRKLAEARINYALNLLDSPNEDGPPKISKRFWSYIKSTRKHNVGVGTLKTGNAEMTNSEQKAEVLSDQFASVFTYENLSTIPSMGPSMITDISPLKFEVSGITRLLRAHDCNYRESLDRLKKSKIRTIFQENPFREICSKNIFPSLEKQMFPRKRGKTKIRVFELINYTKNTAN